MSDDLETNHPLQSDVEAFLSLLLDSKASKTHEEAVHTGPCGSSNIDATTTKTLEAHRLPKPPTPPKSSSTTTPTSHIVLAPSFTSNAIHALNQAPCSSPPNSAPVLFLLRPPPSLSHPSLNPHTLLLSNTTAISAHLHLNFNLPLAAELGIDTSTALPLHDPSPYRQGQTIGLVGRVSDVAEAAKYRFQTEQLEVRLRRLVGDHAPMVNRVSDVFRLCVGVSEEGAIGMFDFTRDGEGGRSERGNEVGTIEEEEEDEDRAEVSDDLTTLPRLSTPAEPTTVTALAFSRTFDASTITQAHTIASTSGFLPTDSSRMLFVTPQPRQAGLMAAKEQKMLVMCVTNVAANLWALRYLSGKCLERWPELDVRMMK